jgi:hypothetical protein
MANNPFLCLDNLRDRQCLQVSKSLTNKLRCMINMRSIQKNLTNSSVYFCSIASTFLTYLNTQTSTSLEGLTLQFGGGALQAQRQLELIVVHVFCGRAPSEEQAVRSI